MEQIPLPEHEQEHVDVTTGTDHSDAALLAQGGLADALDAALARLVTTVATLDDVDSAARVLGETRRSVLVTLVGHVDRATAALHAHRRRARTPPDPADARLLASGDPHAIATAIGTRRNRLAEALEHALEHAHPDDEADLVDELDALLARVELGHVALDARYDLPDLPPTSIAACARVSAAFAHMQSTLPPDPRIRPTARRRPGIPSPRGRRSP